MKIDMRIMITMVFVLLVGQLNARPLTYYQYFTVSEVSPLGERIFFGNGEYNGRIRSNDYIGLENAPEFLGQVYTSRGFILRNANPFFAWEPIIGIAPLELPERADYVRRRASPFVSTENGLWMIRIELVDGIADITRYPRGGSPEDMEHVTSVGPLRWNSIFVDGQVEVYGELGGNLTIGSAGDMWLIDNIMYPNANNLGIWPDDSDPGGMLGLISERNIIIRNNWANGKNNSQAGNSIIINAAIVALGGSFTFQHQNDDWENFQGPEPDERGYIRIKGSLAQRQKGYIHRDNHVGTGYGMVLRYDQRFTESSPPGFVPEGREYITGRHDHLGLYEGQYVLTDVITNGITVAPGVEVFLNGQRPLTVEGDIDINGTAENPVTFRNRVANNLSTIRGDWGINSSIMIRHADFGENIDLDISNDSISISNSKFAYDVHIEGNIYLYSSVFNGEVTLTSHNDLSINRNVFTAGVIIDGYATDGDFVNNTVVGASSEGLLLRRFRTLRIANNIIAFNRWGIVNRHPESPLLMYNDVFDNRHDDYSGCEAGEGSISADPLFVNMEEGDYDLAWNSPCVDDGDPDSPRDPDGSRADMGAYAINHALSVPDDALLPNKFSVSVFPNPFNDVVKITVASSTIGELAWSVINIRGREIHNGQLNLLSGHNSFEINSTQLNSSGVYFLRLKLENQNTIVKIVYIS